MNFIKNLNINESRLKIHSRNKLKQQAVLKKFILSELNQSKVKWIKIVPKGMMKIFL